MEIPSKYIMDPWLKDFKRKYARVKTIVELDISSTTVMERHDAIITRCNNLAELGSTSAKKLRMVYKAVKRLEKALDTSDDEGTLPSIQASSKQIQDPCGSTEGVHHLNPMHENVACANEEMSLHIPVTDTIHEWIENLDSQE
ncbi:hypothetical protein Scep_016208 [Stephania cephalantha]|uniref:Uncharacterized protein n=1 Tax=Stephania cephalantha TaxID=152367 RepID=A0AAP0IMQ8_9MAGN